MAVLVRCSTVFAFAAVHTFAAEPLSSIVLPVDIDAAISAEDPACSADSISQEGCQLNLLQARVNAVSEDRNNEPPRSQAAAEQVSQGVEKVSVHKATVDGSQAASHEHSTASQEKFASADIQAEEVAESAGHCTAQDAAAMHQMGKNAFPKAVADCGRSAYKWFRFHQDAMGKCVRRATGVSAPCSQCFAAAGQYGFDNCKVQCLFGSWCSSLCRGCTSAFDHVTQECVGTDIAVPQPDTC